jgi:murein DD-endopeptidase MepM/ murein hydrolase activator NlpD
VASVHDYKRLENSIVHKVKNAAKIVVKGFIGVFKAIGSFLTRRYTVVLVPHSEKKVYNFHITVISICCFFLVVAGVLGTFFWYGASFNTARDTLKNKDSRLQNVQASLDQLRDETALLLKEARRFETVLSGALSTMGTDRDRANPSASGDFASFLDIRESQEGLLYEVDNIRRLSSYLASAAVPIQEIVAMLDSQSALLTEIPSIWPVKGGLGHISFFFGQNVNPFSGMYYIHKGLDISTFRSGDPVVATADGQIVTIDYTDDFGNYVIIKHKHGYYTRYAHLHSSRVRVGQRVQQSEVIGYIGNTGLSTGPHLHYEVHIGSDVVDPYKYINIRSSIAKRGR